jgi:hypothetical protein
MAPFLSFYTPTFRRPQALARCLASVAAQTAVDDVEQVVVVDHMGVGIAGMYQAIPRYASAIHGRYVHLLADDDVLASPTVVEQLRGFARAHGEPPVIVVRVQKNGLDLPMGGPWPPVCGRIDLGCLVTRGDVWHRHVANYGHRYEGDFDFADALWAAGNRAVSCDVLFLRGDVRRGQPEPPQTDVGADVRGGGAC